MPRPLAPCLGGLAPQQVAANRVGEEGFAKDCRPLPGGFCNRAGIATHSEVQFFFPRPPLPKC